MLVGHGKVIEGGGEIIDIERALRLELRGGEVVGIDVKAIVGGT